MTQLDFEAEALQYLPALMALATRLTRTQLPAVPVTTRSAPLTSPNTPTNPRDER